MPAKKIVDFSSWGELLEYAARTPKFNGGLCSRKSSDNWWSGTPNFDAAVNVARNGWMDAEKKTAKLTAALFDKVSSLVKREYYSYDVTGLDFDMGLLMDGRPECWVKEETKTEDTQGRILRVVFNGFYSAGVDADVLIARGAAVSALIELLEFSGTRVEVVHHTPFRDIIQFRTVIKTADQPLDIGRLAFAVGHRSMFRRIMFSCLEQNPAERTADGGRYGMPHQLDAEHQGDIYIDCAGYGDPQWENPEIAQQWIVAQLKKQGVEIALQ